MDSFLSYHILKHHVGSEERGRDVMKRREKDEMERDVCPRARSSLRLGINKVDGPRPYSPASRGHTTQ